MRTPRDVNDATLAFPANVDELIPAEDEIPEPYWQSGSDWPANLFKDLFFTGLTDLTLVPRDGVDPHKAWRHIRAILGSYAPKHEHKEAAVRYLLDEWFVSASWKRKP